MQGFELLKTEVLYTGYRLNKKATIKQIDNQVTGEAKILLNVEKVWENVVFIKHSELSDVVNQIRLLEQFTFDTNITTCEIGCIKAENSEIPTQPVNKNVVRMVMQRVDVMLVLCPDQQFYMDYYYSQSFEQNHLFMQTLTLLYFLSFLVL